MEISYNPIRHSSLTYSTKNAWAKYVRTRWERDTLSAIQVEWDLTIGQARGVIYAQISQPTIDQIKRHKRGGPLLSLKIEALFWGLELGELLTHALEQEQGRLQRERERSEAEEKRLVEMAHHVRTALGMGAHGNPGPQPRPFGKRVLPPR